MVGQRNETTTAKTAGGRTRREEIQQLSTLLGLPAALEDGCQVTDGCRISPRTEENATVGGSERITAVNQAHLGLTSPDCGDYRARIVQVDRAWQNGIVKP